MLLDLSGMLKTINQYSNLILVLVTIAYVVFSWQTVREMRKAREAELEAYMIASLETLGALSASLCVRNAGQGTALNIEVTISVKPKLERFERKWRHPAIWPGHANYFLLPYDKGTGGIPSLQQLSEQYDSLIVQIRWTSQLKKARRQTFTFNLQEQVQGWYYASHLLPERTTAEHLEIIARHIDKMQSEIGTIANKLQSKDLRKVQTVDDQGTRES